MILVLDNYDSFVHNIVRYVHELGAACQVLRNDEVSVESIVVMTPSHLILSPGPCTPTEAGICVEVVRQLRGACPVLGICLGHQCIAEAYGGRVVRALDGAAAGFPAAWWNHVPSAPRTGPRRFPMPVGGRSGSVRRRT